MEGSPTFQTQHSMESSHSPKPPRSRPLQTTVEDSGDYTQPPTSLVTQLPLSPSSSPMGAAISVQDTNSTSSGSPVTQLTQNDDTSGITSNARNNLAAERKHHKTRGAHRLGAVSFSDSGPYPVTHETFSSPAQDTAYPKSRTKDPESPWSTFAAAGYPIEPTFPQSPAHHPQYQNWGPNYAGAGYPAFPYPTTPGQQSGLPPHGQHNHPWFSHLDPKTTTLGDAFAHHSHSYNPPLAAAHEHMAAPPDNGQAIPQLDELTGYAQVAGVISGLFGPRISPLYRRFTWLQHRLLLSYQDRLTQMEEDLLGFDANDTAHRNFPASEREERARDHGTHPDKYALIERIGILLGQYSRLLASLQDFQRLPAATENEIQAYRTFMDLSRLIIPAEYEFLQQQDLISFRPGPALGPPEDRQDRPEEQDQAPAAQPEVPIRILVNASAVGFLCLSILLVALRDIWSRLLVVLYFVLLVLAILCMTGNVRQLRQLVEG
ncbi:hypothetical protein FZEAL_3187 [Fusarium zealandicum]|uniref:DUF6594 domain-containing protein n=1 Tax=Fusarium zealandicum TaxID=1053134 RepID=A0A8H4XMP1_9HYPO|nr:hypothetical protein FZEAL_3187 [Fusarium zealandicum]